MTTIQKALVQNMYPHMDITLLAEIIDATPNPEVATEILCGLYETPTVPEKVFSDDKSKLYTMTFYNKWTDNVSYEYYSPKTQGCYFPVDVKKEDITEKNYLSLRITDDKEKAYHYYVPLLSQMEKNTSTVELSRWMKLHSKFPYADEVVEIIGEIKSGPPQRVFEPVLSEQVK